MLIDTHCHIDAERFDDDRAAVLARAQAAGVTTLINVGCDLASSARSLDLARTHDAVFATAGIHPHEAEKAPADFEAQLSTMLAHKRCVALGECGLDYYYDHSPRDVQRDVFARQIALARQKQKPLVIHVRDAWDDCLSVLESEGARDAGGVIHCFTSTWVDAQRALDIGFFISIPGVVTFKNAGELPEVVQKVPLDRLLVETDAPYMAPTPFRGKRNEPAFVAHTAGHVATLRQAAVEDVVEAIARNAERLFRLEAARG
jgi:TatD DNase family protein